MKIKNKMRPNTEHLGTSDVTVNWEDFSLSKTIVCDFLDRNALCLDPHLN